MTRLDLDALERTVRNAAEVTFAWVEAGDRISIDVSGDMLALISELRAIDLFEALSELVRAASDIERQRSTSGGINREDWDDLSSTLNGAHDALLRADENYRRD